ncbi:mucin-2-like [Saccostrea cucullata]|uniref:mucin-2-like n=1 Tax=Saccostrea cuccullata TaxID=36930 RepID=UPI002ED2AAFC
MNSGKILTSLCCIVSAFLLLVCQSAALPKEKSNCNPTVDIVFMLDGQSSVNSRDFFKQKAFIRDILDHHESPAGAVQVGFVVCANGNSTTSEFRSYSFDILENLRKLEKPVNKGKHTDQCIRALNRVFAYGGREGVKKIAVLLIGKDNPWNDKATIAHVQEAKDNHVDLLVITTGNKNFRRLHALRNIASDDGKFFVLTSYDGLKPLSADLSTGSCLPIALDLNAKKERTSAPVTTPRHVMPISVSGAMCRSAGNSALEKHILFFGWVKVNCADNERADLSECKCVPRPLVTAKDAESSKSTTLKKMQRKKDKYTATTVSPKERTLTGIAPLGESVKIPFEYVTKAPQQTSTARTESTSIAPVDPKPNKMTNPQTLGTSTIVPEIKTTLYPGHSLLKTPKLTPKIDLSIFLPPEEQTNETYEPKGADLQTIFNLLDLNNTSTPASNDSTIRFNETNSSYNDTIENNILNSAIISLLDKDMEETKKTFEDNLKSSIKTNTKTRRKKPKMLLPLPKYLHTPGKSVPETEAAVPLVLPSSLTIIDSAIKTLSNDSVFTALNATHENTTELNETDSGNLSSQKKLLSLLQTENSVQTNIISFLKDTTYTKSEILDNYTQENSYISDNTSRHGTLKSESDVLKNSSKSALLIKLLNIENSLQSRLISLLNKENFLLGHTDYDYPDLPTLPPLLPESTTAAIPTDSQSVLETTTPSTENTTDSSDVVDLFESINELESAIAIIMNKKSVRKVHSDEHHPVEEKNSSVHTSSGNLPEYNASDRSSESEVLVAKQNVPTSDATTSSPLLITTTNIVSSSASLLTPDQKGYKSSSTYPTKSAPLVTTALHIVKQKVTKVALPPHPKRQRSRQRTGSSRDFRHSSHLSNLLSKRERDARRKGQATSNSKQAVTKSPTKKLSKSPKLNVTRTKIQPTSPSSKVTSLPSSSSSSPSSSSKSSSVDPASPLTVEFTKIVKKDVTPSVPKVADNNIKNEKMKLF